MEAKVLALEIDLAAVELTFKNAFVAHEEKKVQLELVHE